MASFEWCGGNYTGYARIIEVHPSRPSVHLRPEGWSHGIWADQSEVIG